MTQLIVALDTAQPDQAKAWVRELGTEVSFYKVGLELFVSAGPEIIAWLKNLDKQVFLDLKYHDIPNTAAKAVAAAAGLGADLCTIHAAGGRDMLKACQEQAGNTRLLAVTVLTSLDEGSLAETGIIRPLTQQVVALAELARECGIPGVICAPPDLANLSSLPNEFLRVTPGIRPAGTHSNDQKRIMTPGQAAVAGASHIVVGRPITAAPSPGKAARAILLELEETK